MAQPVPVLRLREKAAFERCSLASRKATFQVFLDQLVFDRTELVKQVLFDEQPFFDVMPAVVRQLTKHIPPQHRVNIGA